MPLKIRLVGSICRRRASFYWFPESRIQQHSSSWLTFVTLSVLQRLGFLWVQDQVVLKMSVLPSARPSRLLFLIFDDSLLTDRSKILDREVLSALRLLLSWGLHWICSTIPTPVSTTVVANSDHETAALTNNQALRPQKLTRSSWTWLETAWNFVDAWVKWNKYDVMARFGMWSCLLRWRRLFRRDLAWLFRLYDAYSMRCWCEEFAELQVEPEYLAALSTSGPPLLRRLFWRLPCLVPPLLV